MLRSAGSAVDPRRLTTRPAQQSSGCMGSLRRSAFPSLAPRRQGTCAERLPPPLAKLAPQPHRAAHRPARPPILGVYGVAAHIPCSPSLALAPKPPSSRRLTSWPAHQSSGCMGSLRTIHVSIFCHPNGPPDLRLILVPQARPPGLIQRRGPQRSSPKRAPPPPPPRAPFPHRGLGPRPTQPRRPKRPLAVHGIVALNPRRTRPRHLRPRLGRRLGRRLGHRLGRQLRRPGKRNRRPPRREHRRIRPAAARSLARARSATTAPSAPRHTTASRSPARTRPASGA